MSYINITPYVVQELDALEIFNMIAPEFPNEMKDLPCCIYQAIHRPELIDLGFDEVLTRWQFVMDIVGDKKSGSLSEIVSSVSNAFNSLGFSVNVRDANTAEFNRVIVELTGVYNNYTYVLKPN